MDATAISGCPTKPFILVLNFSAVAHPARVTANKIPILKFTITLFYIENRMLSAKGDMDDGKQASALVLVVIAAHGKATSKGCSHAAQTVEPWGVWIGATYS